MTISAVGCLIGSVVRCFVNESFYFVLIGNFITSLSKFLDCKFTAYGFFLNSPGKFGITWFSEESVRFYYLNEKIPTINIMGSFAGIASGNEKFYKF